MQLPKWLRHLRIRLVPIPYLRQPECPPAWRGTLVVFPVRQWPEVEFTRIREIVQSQKMSFFNFPQASIAKG
jgi:hypothetical protein